MLSMGLGIECQANLNASVLRQKLPQQKHKLLLVNNNQGALNFKPRTSTFSVSHSLPELKLRLTETTRNVKLSAAAESLVAEEKAAADDNLTTETLLEKEKLGVVVKPIEKPRLVLKFIWMEKNIGIALDQMIPGHGSIPLSPYYFWPRKDAWEELKVLLESKPWISQKQMIILLNQATDIINLWQQSGGNLA
ncbi:PREDICTED: 30S ribosomal protein 3, chloroplastic-like [Prunus mume]|uniref:30S ribosomal protein 3, chloroplastic-like n=1 Tax=Prunus mume TaxID=102107 RepID=A0ABM0NVD5_PRUMU|nr:PREDICTED: 30S ribosomal protein 3, chloroplastic-like [Prunus mume]